MISLVLGGAGFIGRHLTHALLKNPDNQVVIVDNFSTSCPDLSEFEQYDGRFAHMGCNVLDLTDDFLLELMNHADRIYHLAGSVGVEYIDKYPQYTLFNNLRLNNKLIPLFEKAQKHVVFSSTSEIYGEGPFHEEANASIGPSSKLRWGYATAKLTAEFMIRASTFPFNIVRFFNVVGPGQVGTYGMVMPRFIEAAKANKPLTIYGDGMQVRSFCHIKDAIAALLLVTDHPGELFNIGNNEPVTIRALAERVLMLTQSTSSVDYVPYNQAFSEHHGDISRRVPDLTKIMNMTGYTPAYTLNAIIRDLT